MDAGSGFTKYHWNTGDTTQQIVANQSGWYGITVTDANNNNFNDTVFVTLLNIYIFPKDSICITGNSINLTTDTTTPKTIPVLHISGTFNNWNPATGPVMASINNNGYYECYRYIPAGNYQLKFTSDPDFKHTVYGSGNTAGTLSTDKAANNIIFSPTVGGVYKIGCNTNTLTDDITLVNFSVVGDAAFGWGTDLPLQYNPTTGLWYGIFSFNTGHIKFRVNAAWLTNYGGLNTDSTLVSYGNDILIPTTGTYFVSLNFNDPTHYIYHLVNVNNPKLLYPTLLWSTGDSSTTINQNPLITTKYYATISNGIATYTDSATVYVPGIIYGSVMTPNNDTLKNVPVVLTGNGRITYDSTMTDSVGNFKFKVMTGDSYIIKASKTNDKNKSNGITALDIALIQSHILKKNLLNSPYKIIAADVNIDGKISPLDLAYMKRLILSFDTTFTNSKTQQRSLWTFLNGNTIFQNPVNPLPISDVITITNLSQIESFQPIIAIKKGDVNWSWNPKLPRKAILNNNITQPIIKP